jgi:hypothetical protein
MEVNGVLSVSVGTAAGVEQAVDQLAPNGQVRVEQKLLSAFLDLR